MRKLFSIALVCAGMLVSVSSTMGAEKTIVIEGKFYKQTANGSYVPCVECNQASTVSDVVSAAVCLPCQASSNVRSAVSSCGTSSGAFQLGVCGSGRSGPVRNLFKGFFSLFSCR